MVAAIKMHLVFVKKMGLTTNNFASTYLNSLVKVQNMDNGCSQITDVYEEEGRREN